MRIAGRPPCCARRSPSPRQARPRSARACWPPRSGTDVPVGARHPRRSPWRCAASATSGSTARTVGSPFDPLSAFHRTADGWLRLHANYPWHRAAALRGAGLRRGRRAGRDRGTRRRRAGDRAARRGRRRRRSAHRATGGARRRPAASARRAPPRWAGAAPRPARRPRVLDLTRVIAGPVATRTLAAHGADVLRLDPPRPARDPAAGTGTRCRASAAPCSTCGAHRTVLEELLAGADVVVTGYRPGALDRFGLAPRGAGAAAPGAGGRHAVGLGPRAARGPGGAASTASCRRRAGSPTPRDRRRPRRAARPGCSTTPPATWRRPARLLALDAAAPRRAAATTSGSRWPVPRRGCSALPRATPGGRAPSPTRRRISSSSTRRTGG